MKKPQNNYAFIDGQNLNLSIQRLGWKLDFRKFRVYLSEKYGVGTAYYFLGFVEGNSNLYTSLQKDGYILVFKPTLTLSNGKVKGNVDAELVLHAMIQYENYEKAVIVTGDGDFYCLVDYFIKNNKLLKLLIPDRNHFSSLFRNKMVYISFASDFRNKLEYDKNAAQKKRGITAGRNPLDGLSWKLP